MVELRGEIPRVAGSIPAPCSISGLHTRVDEYPPVKRTPPARLVRTQGNPPSSQCLCSVTHSTTVYETVRSGWNPDRGAIQTHGISRCPGLPAVGLLDRVKMSSSLRARSFDYEGAGAIFTDSRRGQHVFLECAVTGCRPAARPRPSERRNRGFESHLPDTAHLHTVKYSAPSNSQGVKAHC